MPNWCSNNVTLEGPVERIRELADAYAAGRFCDSVMPIPEEDKELGTCSSTWGTKWDVGDEHSFEISDDGRTLTLSFDSAWAPPTNVYAVLDQEDIVVDAFYFEPGMAFCGRWAEGYDDYYEFGSMDAEQISDTVPVEIDEMFAISSSVSEYEEEQRMEDDLYRWTKLGGEKLSLTAT